MAGTDWKKALGDAVWRLMVINLAVFTGFHVAVLLGASQNSVGSLLALPGNLTQLLQHPWTVLTYMFTQVDVMHFIFNMLWLWCFGALLQRTGQSARRIYALYVDGGLAGAVVFVALAQAGHTETCLIGSSAAVLSVIAASGILCGKMRVGMMFIGMVQVRWMAAGVVALILLSDWTAGGAMTMSAHAAGALAGVLTAFAVRRHAARRLAEAPIRVKPWNGNAYAGERRPYKRGLDATEQAALDALLVKVRQGGYAALSASEKQNLFALSQKIKE